MATGAYNEEEFESRVHTDETIHFNFNLFKWRIQSGDRC